MADFQTWVFDLEDIGFFDVALPFLLIFALVYAILEKSKILGKESKNINAVVSLVLAFFFVQNQELVFLLRSFLPNVSIIFIVIIMFLLLLALFMGDKFEGLAGTGMFTAAVIAAILVIWALLSDFLETPDWLYGLIYDQDIGILIPLIVFIFALFWVLSDGKGGKTSYFETFGDMLSGKRRR